MRSDDLSANNSDSEHCLEFSKDVADTIFILKVVLGSFGILVSLLVILLIGVMKSYKQFVYRLVVYLMAVNTLLALFQILELIPLEVTDEDNITIRNGSGWQEACSIIGYLDIGIVWIGNLFIVWTMLYMLSLSWQLHRLKTSQHSEPQGHVKVREITGVLLVIFTPFLFTWIPFMMDMYGPSGLMCWIKTDDKNGCSDSKLQHLSVALMMAMFYGPLVAIVVFGFVCMIVIILLLHRTSKHLHGGIRQQYHSCMKEIGMLIVYPLLYCLFCFVMLMTRIYSFTHANSENRSPYYPLWIVHAVADPSRIVIPGLAFLLHPYVWKNILSRHFSPDVDSAYTKYSVPPEDDDIDEGIIIRPTGDRYGSFNNDLLFNKTRF